MGNPPPWPAGVTVPRGTGRCVCVWGGVGGNGWRRGSPVAGRGMRRFSLPSRQRRVLTELLGSGVTASRVSVQRQETLIFLFFIFVSLPVAASPNAGLQHLGLLG